MTKPPHDDSLPAFCDYEGSDYRTRFWDGQGREYEDLAERIALRQLLPPRGKRIIDIGCGFGRLADLYSGYQEVVLMDPSKSLLQEALDRLGPRRFTYVAANVYQMPFSPGSFSTAVTVRVLHHLSDVPRAFAAIRSILQPAGAFVLEYANKRHLKALLRHLVRPGSPNPTDEQPYEFAPLNFDFHPNYIEQGLKGAGFAIECQLAASHFRLPMLKRAVPASTLSKIDGWLQAPTARLKLTPSIFLRTRVPGDPSASPSSNLFCCPHCHGLLALEAGTLSCMSCNRKWSASDGIYDFR